MDPRRGATLVAARPPLIAFNLEVDAPLDLAVAAARAVREGGADGLPGVRALGLELETGGIVQVSVNVEDHEAVPLATLLEAVAPPRARGRRRGRRAAARARPSRGGPTTSRCATAGRSRRRWKRERLPRVLRRRPRRRRPRRRGPQARPRDGRRGLVRRPGAATPAERTAGGYVRVGAPEDGLGQALLQAASDVSALHGVVVEVQWREEILGHIDAGTWRQP